MIHYDRRCEATTPAPLAEVIWQEQTTSISNFTCHDLEKRVEEHAQEDADVSYTRELIEVSIPHVAKKLSEEAVETVIAALGGERLTAEAADVIYHLLVVLAARDITLAEVEAVLAPHTRRLGLERSVAPGRRREHVSGE